MRDFENLPCFVFQRPPELAESKHFLRKVEKVE